MQFSTRLLHDAQRTTAYLGAVNPPVVHASVFAFKTYREFLDGLDNFHKTPWYGRLFNPTVNALERKIAELEETETAIAFSSGMAAISTSLLALLAQGDHLLMVDSVFAPVREFCETTLRRMGIETEYFSSAEVATLEARMRDNTRLVYLESPGSYTFDVQDLAFVASLARSRSIFTIADNTWATPVFQKPLKLGIDLVVHSGTKYIAGHSDLTLGLIATSSRFFDIVKPVAGLLGACLSPDDAYLALRGLRTLPLRMKQHQESALRLAEWLERRIEVRQVLHPGLPSSRYHLLASQQQTGFSGLFSFRLHETVEGADHAFLDSLRIFTIGVSWGGYESIITPLGCFHLNEPEWRRRRTLGPGMFRVSVGLEALEDLVKDLEHALTVWRSAARRDPPASRNPEAISRA